MRAHLFSGLPILCMAGGRLPNLRYAGARARLLSGLPTPCIAGGRLPTLLYAGAPIIFTIIVLKGSAIVLVSGPRPLRGEYVFGSAAIVQRLDHALCACEDINHKFKIFPRTYFLLWFVLRFYFFNFRSKLLRPCACALRCTVNGR